MVQSVAVRLVLQAIVVVGILVTAFAGREAGAGPVSFGPIINVSQTSGETRHPHMAVDDGGTLHVVYADVSPTTHQIFYRRSADRGQSFTAPVQLSAGGGSSLRPRLAVLGNVLYVVWHQDVSSTKDIMFRRSADGGQSWGPIVNISNTPGNSIEGRVAVGPDGTVYIVWDEATPDDHIAFTRSFNQGGSFEAPRQIGTVTFVRNCSPGEPTGSCTAYPGIAVDRNTGNVYVIWHDDVMGQKQVLFMRSTDRGDSFSPRLQLSHPPAGLHAHCAAMSIGPTGRIMVAWESRRQADPHRHDSKISHSTDGGLSFSPEVNLSNGATSNFADYPWPAQGADGTIVVGWEDNTVGAGGLDAVVKVSNDGGATFGERLNVSENSESASTEVITLFSLDGTLYVLWEDYAFGEPEAFLRVAAGAGGTPPGGSARRETDFDGDGRADVAVYRGSTGEWLVRRSADLGLTQVGWGSPVHQDVAVPGDYDGDGRADLAVYRLTTGEWFVSRSGGGLLHVAWGAPTLGDFPVPADYDGDGRVDLAVYRRSTGEWLLRRSTDGGLTHLAWGSPFLNDTPVPADYDGDGRVDLAVYRRSTGEWLLRRSTDTGLTHLAWGSPFLNDAAVPGDYDGDGRADLAVYRRSTGEWLLRRSADTGLTHLAWGSPFLDDVPVPADFDGDGITDIAVYRRTNGEWFIRWSSDGELRHTPWGAPTLGDVPLPVAPGLR
jgi:hypothetical protein